MSALLPNPSHWKNSCEQINEGGKGYFRDPWSALLFPVKCEIAIFSSWIVISIVAVNCDFPRCSLLFSVKLEMPMLYFSWIVKGLLYFPWNVIYTPPLPPSLIWAQVFYLSLWIVALFRGSRRALLKQPVSSLEMEQILGDELANFW